MITGPMCEAARVLVQIDRLRLAETVHMSEREITDFEKGDHALPVATIELIARALEDYGAIFLPEEGSRGVGVRLKFSRSVTDRLEDLENEGGPSRPDEVP
ncbi:DNA-binding XRE family transcriptional regulator [Aquamicrobium terrae]